MQDLVMLPVFESVDTFTADEFEAWLREQERRGDIAHYELLNGRIVMTPPAGWPHGGVEAGVVGVLQGHIAPRRLGRVFGSSQGYLLPSGDVVEPDVSFVSWERWAAAPPPEEGKFLRVVPDLVVEILSPSTASRDRGEKLLLYALNGVREYWIADYRLRRVSVWLAGDDRRFTGPTTYEADADAELQSSLVPGLTLPIASLFE